MVEHVDLTEFLDLETLGNFLNDFAAITGITSCAMTPDGKFLVDNTPPYNRLCFELIKSTEKGLARCQAADHEIMARVTETKRHAIHICRNGLIDFAAPIVVEEQVLGCLFGGQILSEPPDRRWHRQNAIALDINPGEYLKALGEITIMPMEKIEAVARMLEGIANALTNLAYQRLLHEQRAKEIAATVRELSTPVIPLWDKILALPLIGSIDTSRAQFIMDGLLEGITQQGAEEVIIDITGVPVIDTRVADHLLQTVQAARLLGAECIITGISPEIAQTMVSLGVNLSDIVTRRDLQDGIAYALARLDLSIAPRSSLI